MAQIVCPKCGSHWDWIMRCKYHYGYDLVCYECECLDCGAHFYVGCALVSENLNHLITVIGNTLLEEWDGANNWRTK